LFYDPEAMRELLRQGRLHSVVAKDPAGVVVAHMAMIRERPDDRSADNLAGMMLPRYRGSGVLGKLGAVILPVYLQLDLVGLQLYSVTHHLISQRIGIESGAVVCGCLISYSPGTNAGGLSVEERKAIVMQFYPFQPPQRRTLYLPERYHALVGDIFDQLQFPVLMRTASAALPQRVSVAESQYNVLRGTAQLRLDRLGDDCPTVAERLRAQHKTSKAFHVDIPLDAACAVAAIDRLNDLGWFFGGIIFERANTDLLRLQWTREPFSDDTPVYDDFGKRVLEFVRRDRRRCRAPGSELGDSRDEQ
jgi:hypothetical protein